MTQTHEHQAPSLHSSCITPSGLMDEKDKDKDTSENEGYTGEIKGGLRPSMKLVVMGIVNKKPQSMEVLVSSQPQEEEEGAEGDVGLQLKISFKEKAIQRNARLSGKWGPSENNLSYFPFAAGESFKMEIVCEHQQFRVLVDGQPLCGFSHRFRPLASLTSLRVFGDLQLTKRRHQAAPE
uniref:Galectin n=1 Tax=Neogobius melanostomus TaxID=47308 RepID=A0A8C6TL21_9GOBI